jgi:hypothetical protein
MPLKPTITINTLTMVDNLRTAGIPEDQIIIVCDVIQNMIESRNKEFMRNLERRLVIKLGTMIVLTLFIVAAIVKFL